MSALNDQDTEALRQLLERREKQLHGEVQDTTDLDQADREGFVGVAPDMVDVAQNKRMADFRHAERERDQLELMEIAQARERMADGSYGDCVDCGEAIDVARLQVQPWASRCIECQERYEVTHPLSVPVVSTGQDLGAG